MRAMRMSPEELKTYTDKLIAQQKRIEQNMIELAVYSNGAFTYNDMLQIPAGQVKDIEDIITKKLKQDRGIKEQSLL
jgi:methionine synthase II (cobalamin-independent)